MEKKIITDFENMYKNLSLNNDLKLRKEFLTKFIDKGFPSKKLESWKFSDLNQIINKNIENLIFYNNSTKPHKIDVKSSKNRCQEALHLGLHFWIVF